MEHDASCKSDITPWIRDDLFDSSHSPVRKGVRGIMLGNLNFRWIFHEDIPNRTRHIEPRCKRIDSESSDTFELLDALEGFARVIRVRHRQNTTDE